MYTLVFVQPNSEWANVKHENRFVENRKHNQLPTRLRNKIRETHALKGTKRNILSGSLCRMSRACRYKCHISMIKVLLLAGATSTHVSVVVIVYYT